MPELPEVETVVRLLRPDVVGRRVEGASVAWARTLGGISPAAFGRAVGGSTITGAERRGKYLLFALQRDGVASGTLVGHLRMTGRMEVVPQDAPRSPWLRVRLRLAGGAALDFIDVRKFGRFTYARELSDALPPLGPEPLGPTFTATWLHRALGSRSRQIKPLLLDQSFLAGLGNIYVDESLFTARIHPLQPARRVGTRKINVLHAAIQRTLREAIEREGSSFDTFYRTPQGQPGSYQAQFQVYGRDGSPCRRCGRTIKRLVVGQRGTHICPACQRTPRGLQRPKTT
jgi:formamidopyrimidine-DNA glycosylase